MTHESIAFLRQRIADLDDPNDMRAGAALEIAALEALPQLLDDAERLQKYDEWFRMYGVGLLRLIECSKLGTGINQFDAECGSCVRHAELKALLATVPR